MTSISSFLPNGRCNILLFGFSAVGKSSFVNTLTTNENADFFKMSKIAPVRIGDVNEQCTISFQKYELNHSLRIFDTWGFSGNNYKMNEFERMLDGEFKVNSGPTPKGIEKKNDQIIDIVIFFVSAENGVNNDQLRSLLPFYDTSMKRKKAVFFSVTKMDLLLSDKELFLVEPGRAFNMCHKGREFKKEIQKITQLFGKIVILPFINYQHDDYGPNELIKRLKMVVNGLIRSLNENRVKDGNNAKKDLMMDILKGEKPEEIKFLLNSKPRNPNEINPQLVELDVDDEPKHIVSNIYFRTLKMGKHLFRLFVVQSMADPENDIIGIFEPLSYSYFEVTEKLSSNIRIAFDQTFGNDFVSSFIFYNRDGKPHAILDPETTLFIQLNLKGGEKKLALTKREFKKFHVFVENNIQWRKQVHFDEINKTNVIIKFYNEEMDKKYERKMKMLEEELSEKIKNIAVELEREKIFNEELQEKLQRQEVRFQRSIEEQEGRLVEKIDGNSVYREKFNEMEKLVARMKKEKIEPERRKLKKNVFQKKSTIIEYHHFEGLKKLCNFNFSDFHLLYRGSRDGFNASDFHKRCDIIKGTLVVIKSDINNVFGGFNPLKWNVTEGWCKADSWIFGFDKNEIVKFLPTIIPEQAIYCTSTFGAWFGFEILIYSHCNAGNSSYTLGNSIYDLKGRNAHFLNGGTKNFKVKDIEVYTVPSRT